MTTKVILELTREQHDSLVHAMQEVVRYSETPCFSGGVTPGELLRIVSNAPVVDIPTAEQLDMQAAEERAKKRLERES